MADYEQISEVKKEMTDEFISIAEVQAGYELEAGKSFEEQFSKVSPESIFFFVFAKALWVFKKLFEKHKADVTAELDARLPHRRKWYQTKVLEFQYPNRPLITDTDKYDNAGLSTSDIEDLQVVKFCAVSEKESKLQIKVAKGTVGNRQTLSADEVLGLGYYLSEIKDAGVLIEIVNQQADKFFCKVEIFYNPMLLNPDDKIVETAIKEYVSNLDFNGEYSNMGLTDRLQQITGVVIPHLVEVKTQRANNLPEICAIRTVAESGYFIVQDDSDLEITYTVYE